MSRRALAIPFVVWPMLLFACRLAPTYPFEERRLPYAEARAAWEASKETAGEAVPVAESPPLRDAVPR